MSIKYSVPREDAEITMAAGKVEWVKYTANSARVKIIDGPQYEFKKNADKAKKLRLQIGDEVLAIGFQCNSNKDLVYGFDVTKHGYVAQGKYTLSHGTVAKIIKSLERQILVISTETSAGEEGKQMVMDDLTFQNVKIGDKLSLLVHKYANATCSGMCNGSCKNCKESSVTRKYEIVRSERRG